MGTQHSDRATIDLVPVIAADGSEEWVAPSTTAPAAAPDGPSGVTVDDGIIQHDDDTQSLSSVPTERMASGKDWNQIIGAIAAAEAGRSTDTLIQVEEGGALVPVSKGETGQPLSTVPEETMAAPALASQADLQECRRYDPNNVEGWRFIDDPTIPGLQFSLAPAGERFTFFCFRSPTMGGRWYLTVLDPNLDDLIGHENHMLRLRMGSEYIPVVCSGQGSSTHADLGEIRGAAAKFALYHTLRSHGHVPFSA